VRPGQAMAPHVLGLRERSARQRRRAVTSSSALGSGRPGPPWKSFRRGTANTSGPNRSPVAWGWCPRNAAWSAELRAELLSFPAGKHDDQVDALALIGQLLENVLPGREPKVEDQELTIDFATPPRGISAVRAFRRSSRYSPVWKFESRLSPIITAASAFRFVDPNLEQEIGNSRVRCRNASIAGLICVMGMQRIRVECVFFGAPVGTNPKPARIQRSR